MFKRADARFAGARIIQRNAASWDWAQCITGHTTRSGSGFRVEG